MKIKAAWISGWNYTKGAGTVKGTVVKGEQKWKVMGKELAREARDGGLHDRVRVEYVIIDDLAEVAAAREALGL